MYSTHSYRHDATLNIYYTFASVFRSLCMLMTKKDAKPKIIAYCNNTSALYSFSSGRFLMGACQGAVTVILRTYIGETSSTIIASLPPEQREKSTLKYTAFFIAFQVCAMSVLLGPGKLSLFYDIHMVLSHLSSFLARSDSQTH